tara:strand:+ start:292 stop:543 length:252 start_codon:yes stop_codon:yes gene_type:complete
MQITRGNLRTLIREMMSDESVYSSMNTDIEKMFLKDVIKFVREDIVPEGAPALGGMPLHVFLQKAADLARAENPNELVSDYGS